MENKNLFRSSDVVVFDLCGTIYDSNTTFDFLDYHFRNHHNYQRYRKISRLFATRAANKLSTRILNYDFIRKWGVSFFKGISKADLLESFHNFYAEVLSAKEIHITKTLLEQAKIANARIVLMSASLDIIVDELASKLDIKESYATQLTLANDRYTGQIAGDLLGTKHRLIKMLNAGDKKVIFISDNLSDANVIRHVNEFYAVSPAKNLEFWKRIKGVTRIYEV